MNLEGLINISGKNGLYKVISKSKNMIIVESIIDKKRMPVSSANQANMLEEIGIYTYEDTKPLSEVFEEIAKKENYNQTISHKLSKNKLLEFFRQIVTDFDEDKVYISDIKKVIQWYNLLQKKKIIKQIEKKKNTKKKK
tara:strand:- start:2229 stop:2645 length:417 start_codon:yes stop_codon:yes gene_type:complete